MKKGTLVTLVLCSAVELLPVQSFTIPQSTSLTRPSYSPLFQQPPSAKNHQFREFSDSREAPVNTRRFPFKRVNLRAPQWTRKFVRSLLAVALAFFVSFGGNAIRTQPAHAEAAAITESTPLEKIIDKYVKDHMFDDDVYEPVESVYREAITDKVQGTHQKALTEITSSVLGQGGLKVAKSSSSSGIGDILLRAVDFLRRKGLSESMAIIVLTGSFVVAAPVAFLLGGMMVGSQSKRQINSVMKKRYGDTYTVDATVKVEEDVEVPDDDEDDDEDEDDEDEDEDEEDE